MNIPIPKVILIVLCTLIGCATFVALVVSAQISGGRDGAELTKRISTCVESGGSWIQSDQNCIAGNSR